MITSMAIQGFFDYLDRQILTAPYLSGYVSAGYTYTSNLTFDDKLRKKIVLTDDTLNKNKVKPIWCMKLYSRDGLKVSANHPNRPIQSARTNLLAFTASTQNIKVASINLNIAFIGNSFLLLETLEETLLTKEMRRDYAIDPDTASDPGYAVLLAALPTPVKVAISDFTLDGIDKEDTSQYGPIIQLNATAQLTFPIILPTGAVDYPVIQTVVVT